MLTKTLGIAIAVVTAILAMPTLANAVVHVNGPISISGNLTTAFNGTGRITLYTIPIGHDGWETCDGLNFPANCPSGDVIQIINGTDLTSINNQSVVIPSITNVTSFNVIPTCTGGIPLNHAVWTWCTLPHSASVFEPELRLAVINP